jgi:hypothetical protein
MYLDIIREWRCGECGRLRKANYPDRMDNGRWLERGAGVLGKVKERVVQGEGRCAQRRALKLHS